MMAISPTKLRENLYNLLDQVIETQKPLEIVRHGHLLKLMVEKKSGKLAHLASHPEAMRGDPEAFVQIDWSEHWNKDEY